MTETERKALALVRDVADGYEDVSIHHVHNAKALRSALCRAIEQHEAFRQEVSDALETFKHGNTRILHSYLLDPFIIAKPDPLAECLLELDLSEDEQEARHDAEWLVKTIEKRGGKIVWREG